jgi:hypothetical protein
MLDLTALMLSQQLSHAAAPPAPANVPSAQLVHTLALAPE